MTELELLKDFLTKVKAMREYQRAYFKTGSSYALGQAKNAEYEVDKTIGMLDDSGQGQLFAEGTKLMPEQRYDKCMESFFRPVDDLREGDVVTYTDKNNCKWTLEVTDASSPTKTFRVLNGPNGHGREFSWMHFLVAGMLEHSYVHRNGVQVHPEVQS